MTVINLWVPRERGMEDNVFGMDRTAERRYWDLHGLLPAQNGWPREVLT